MSLSKFKQNLSLTCQKNRLSISTFSLIFRKPYGTSNFLKSLNKNSSPNAMIVLASTALTGLAFAIGALFYQHDSSNLNIDLDNKNEKINTYSRAIYASYNSIKNNLSEMKDFIQATRFLKYNEINLKAKEGEKEVFKIYFHFKVNF